MARRKLSSVAVGNHSVKVYRDSEWNEFVVVTIGENRKAEYFTTDRDDANATANTIVKTLTSEIR